MTDINRLLTELILTQRHIKNYIPGKLGQFHKFRSGFTLGEMTEMALIFEIVINQIQTFNQDVGEVDDHFTAVRSVNSLRTKLMNFLENFNRLTETEKVGDDIELSKVVTRTTIGMSLLAQDFIRECNIGKTDIDLMWEYYSKAEKIMGDNDDYDDYDDNDDNDGVKNNDKH